MLDSAARPPGAELMCAPTITPAMPAPKTLTTTAAINPARRTPDGRRTFGGTPACAYAGGPGGYVGGCHGVDISRRLTRGDPGGTGIVGVGQDDRGCGCRRV
ncbi:hypothetical protein I545_0432 [Mycobacterium kansasii 662]|uniref:Uncharacterized protein n=1 Tax=Mycobacterium kansasii 662 TaxID=1299326 RepID=X7ZNS4_MYCKA|nr:hypothetical protein I545_0432 [Mycobacterium kansasii 662]